MINYCGICPHNGDVILTTYPPKIRCELTGKLHFTTDACDVDMVAVVRCKDCKYLEEDECPWTGVIDWNGYCSRGERREDDRD